MHYFYLLACIVALPITLLQQLSALPNFDKDKFEHAHLSAPPTSIRLHPIKGTAFDAGHLTQVPWCSQGYYLPQRPQFTLDPLLHAGAYYVQEASSMFLHHLLQQLGIEQPGLRVLDLCAAPGGKSTLIASLLAPDSLLLSNEVIRSRASILEENITKWGYHNTWVCSNDPRDLGRLAGYFDVVLVDAPCSGSGLFRKDPRALAEWSEANVQLCSERQQRILADVWPALKQDGYLVYATCSYSEAENEAILDFMADHFDLSSVRIPLSEEWGVLTSLSPRHQLAGYRFSPERLSGEGFFIAILRKNKSSPSLHYPKFKTTQSSKIAAASAHLFAQQHWLMIEKEQNLFSAIHLQHEADWHYLKQYVYLRKAGILAGTPSAKEWLPEHDVALSCSASSALPSVSVSLEQALMYLKKEPIELGNIKGWHIVLYKGLGLGWVKGLGNRVNNYLPKNWRIRMDIDLESL